jgi:uncharacterized YccA/Bax inhibitor family protein
MTVRGSMTKFGFLMLMVVAGAAYNWHLYTTFQTQTMNTLMWVGLIGGFVVGLVITFKPITAKYLSPLYGLLEGLMIGGFSVLVNAMVGQKYPGIVLQAVGLTFGVAFAMFLLYNFRIIRATERFKAVLISACAGVAFFYLIYWILMLFGVNLSFMSWTDSSALGIGINLVVIAIAALTLIMDFDRIEQGAAMKAPKHMEWYGAFGLLVSMVWLYVQILKLLSRLASSRN